jgi:hypothetical protein
MHKDIIYNILLQSNDYTIANLCQINKQANAIGDDKYFWEAKFKLHYLEPLMINYDPDVLYPYITWFHYAMLNVEQTKNILKINYLEKNRKYDKTNGIFKLSVDNIQDYVYYFPGLKAIHPFRYLIFTLLINAYHLELSYMDDNEVMKKIDLGEFTIKQVEEMLPCLLEMTDDIIADENGYEMVYDSEDVFSYYNLDIMNADPTFANILLIRRGMWEMIHATK